MDKRKILFPYGRKRCPVCKRLVSVSKSQYTKGFELPSHGPGIDTFFCAGSGTKVKAKVK